MRTLIIASLFFLPLLIGASASQPVLLEIHHINIGQGDATFIVGPTGKTLLIDAGETYWNSSADAQRVGAYIQAVTGHKHLDYVLITHFHVDHVGYVGRGGLWHLVEGQDFTVGQTFHRDYSTYLGTTSTTFTNWRTYLQGAGRAKLNPTIAQDGAVVDLGAGAILQIVTVDGNGKLLPGNYSGAPITVSENDYSLGILISYDEYDEWIGGDLSGRHHQSYNYYYHDVESSVAREVGDVDVLRANHHGSCHSSNATFVNQLDPEVSIVSVGDTNNYGHPCQDVMDRLLATSDVYLTERGDPNTNIGGAVVAGDVVIRTDGQIYTVNDAQYIATTPYRLDQDVDGFFNGIDGNDNDLTVGVFPYGGCGLAFQSCPPTGLSASIYEHDVTLTWQHGQAQTCYNVHMAQGSDFPKLLYECALGNSLIDVRKPGQYSYWITAVRGSVESLYSSEVAIIVR